MTDLPDKKRPYRLPIGPCSVEGCEQPGGRSVTTDSPVCEKHYQRRIRAAKEDKR